MKNRFLTIPFLWWMLSTLLITALVYLLTRNLLITSMVGLADLGMKGIIYTIYRNRENKRKSASVEPAVIWLTGLPGAGKTTLGKALAEELRNLGNRVEHLDGDEIRSLFPQTGFSREERDRHIRRVGYMAGKLEANAVVVVASFISPYRESRAFVRSRCHRFIEVYVSTPPDICEQRDPKGLYTKARTGEIKNFTGISDPYEIPSVPEVITDTSRESTEESVKKIIDLLKQKETTDHV